MNIAIVHPTNWPQVRRGTERFMNEMAAYLGSRGHDATIVTSHRGPGDTQSRAGFTTEYHRSLWSPWMASYGLLDFHVFPLTTLRRVSLRRFDLVHTFNFTDTLAACLARRWTGVPVLLHLNTIPPPVQYRRSLSTGGALLRRAIEQADQVITISRNQQEYFEKRFGRSGIRLEAPVDTDKFRHSSPRDHTRPVLLCASALEDRRKGGRLLMRAFNEVKRVRPEVRLELCHPTAPGLKDELLGLVAQQWRSEVQFTHIQHEGHLAQAYGRAAALVLPSMWEAFPMVVIEALATGTPVAGTKDGGLAELIANPKVGRAFDPGPPDSAEPSNLDGLVKAILETIELSRQPETAASCRDFALQFSWQTLGPRYEEVYRSLMSKPA